MTALKLVGGVGGGFRMNFDFADLFFQAEPEASADPWAGFNYVVDTETG